MAYKKKWTFIHYFILVFFTPFLIIGFGSTGSGLWTIISEKDYQDWPTVPAKITVLVDESIATSEENRILHLDYEYQGMIYEKQYSFKKKMNYSDNGENVPGAIDLLPKIAAQKNKRVLVFVNPEQPRDIRYMQYLTPLPFFMISFGLFFSAMPVFMIAAFILERQTTPLEVECR